MSILNNCYIPDDLIYWVREHVWIRREDDGTITIGMTDAAQHLAGIVVNASPKKPGQEVKKGRSAGTVESGKWVGPIKAPVSGVIVAANEALKTDPTILNRDPYGEGWFVRIQPANWEAESGDLVSGEKALADYQAFLNEKGIHCAGR
jgi:glycine cleavage system H protein